MKKRHNLYRIIPFDHGLDRPRCICFMEGKPRVDFFDSLNPASLRGFICIDISQ